VAASRWKAQFNENGKVPAWSSALPELDHNEILGWSEDRGRRFFVVALRHEAEPRACRSVSSSRRRSCGLGAGFEEVWASGRSALARLVTLVAHGDFTATYLGLAHGADPAEMDAIVRIKRALAET